MFETNVVIIGNVLTAPEWRKVATSGALVATFRVASTARKMDRASSRWVDGDSLRLRVTCWRRLAENVCASIAVGDPVVVTGRIFTRDWTDNEGGARVSYEMEAAAVGHDLTRGKARFFRTRPTATDATTGPETDALVRGETAEPVPTEEAPIEYGDGLPDAPEPEFDPLSTPRATSWAGSVPPPGPRAGYSPSGEAAREGVPGGYLDQSGDGLSAETDGGGTEGAGPSSGALGRGASSAAGHGRSPDAGGPSVDLEGLSVEEPEMEIKVEALTEEPDPRPRPRRPAKRQPVAA